MRKGKERGKRNGKDKWFGDSFNTREFGASRAGLGFKTQQTGDFAGERFSRWRTRKLPSLQGFEAGVRHFQRGEAGNTGAESAESHRMK